MATPYVSADEVPSSQARTAGSGAILQPAEERRSDDDELLVDAGSDHDVPAGSSMAYSLSPAQRIQSMKKLKYGVDPKFSEYSPRYSREDANAASQKLKVGTNPCSKSCRNLLLRKAEKGKAIERKKY